MIAECHAGTMMSRRNTGEERTWLEMSMMIVLMHEERPKTHPAQSSRANTIRYRVKWSAERLEQLKLDAAREGRLHGLWGQRDQ